MTDQQDYQQVVTDFAAQLRGLLAPDIATAEAKGTVRGVGGVPPNILASRAGQLVSRSQQAGQLHTNMLDSFSVDDREAAQIKLLAQATGQVQAALALLSAAQGQGAGPSVATRGVSDISIQSSLADSAAILEMPVDAVSKGAIGPVRRAMTMHPTDPAAARAALQSDVDSTVRYITLQAGQVGGLVLRDLLLMDGATVLEGVRLVSKDAASALDQLISGAGAMALQLLTSAAQLLTQAYQWVLSLLGQQTADQAIGQANNWLTDLRQEVGTGDSGGPFGVLVTKIFMPDAVKSDVARWLQTSTAALDPINQAADTVSGLADKYKTKTEQVQKLVAAVALARRVAALAGPQGQALVAAINLGLLGYTIYTGYDHVDSGAVVFAQRFKVTIPHRVDGVRATVQKTLGVTEAAAPAPNAPAPSGPPAPAPAS